MSAAVHLRRQWLGKASGMARGWADAPHAQMISGALLSLAAVAEALARAVAIRDSSQLVLALGLLAVATALPTAFLRPLAAAVAACLAATVSLSLFHTLTVAGAASVLLALLRLGRATLPRSSGTELAAITVLGLPFLVLALVGRRPAATEAGVLTVTLAGLAPATAWVGVAWRARREAAEASAERRVIAGNLLEHTARGERARIARELHDVVAHHISMVAVQAETARLTTPGMPAAGAQRLSAIGDTARAALTEMRRLLGVLREDARTGEAEGAERQPQPGLRQLNQLLDESRSAAGTGTRLILRGPPAILDPGVELAAYRIAQEALTNARRHAPGAAVDVELRFTPDALFLRVRDDGPGPPAFLDGKPETEGGHGLQGMRERAAAVGGRLVTGPAPGGGFVVEATLPVRAEGLALR